MVFAFSLGKVPRSVVVILNIRNGAAKCHLPSVLTFLNWVSLNVGRHADDFSWIFRVLEILFDKVVIRHMLVSRLDLMFHMRLELETFLVSSSDLRLTLFSALK